MMAYNKRYISNDSSIINESNDTEALSMKALTANEAKTHFGEMLLNAQRGPVQINKNGKPVAVLVSFDEYENIEALKLSMLQSRASRARDDVANQDTVDGESFFDELELGKYD
jgi:prevent-host-death family protein